MKISNTFAADVDLPADGLLVDASRPRAAAPRSHRADAPVLVTAPVNWPAADGISFPTANPWPRGGLNE